MARFLIQFTIDTEEVDQQILAEYLPKGANVEQLTDDQLRAAICDWLEDHVEELLQDEHCTITLVTRSPNNP